MVGRLNPVLFSLEKNKRQQVSFSRSVIWSILLLISYCKIQAQANLALGKTVTASSATSAGNGVANLVDGSNTTYTQITNTLANSNTEWVEIDLGADYFIENISISGNTANPAQGQRFMVVTRPSTEAAPNSPADVSQYLTNSVYNRLIYTQVASSSDQNPLGRAAATTPEAAGTKLGAVYTTLSLNVGIHLARYVRILAINNDALSFAEVAVFPTSVLPVRTLTNGGFEANLPAANSNGYFPEADVPGWSTTDGRNTNGTFEKGGMFELWRSGFVVGGTTYNAYAGNVFSELNAAMNGELTQAPICVAPGEVFTWSFAHKGRTGVDVMFLRIDGVDVVQVSDNNTATGTHSAQILTGGGGSTTLYTVAGTQITNVGTVVPGTVSTSGTNAGWARYSGTWTNTTGANKIVQFGFRATSSSSGDISAGNFLDDVNISGLTAVISIQSPTGSGPENGSPPPLPALYVSGVVSGIQTINLRIVGGTATHGTDYTTTGNATVFTVPVPAGTYDGTTATAILLSPYIQLLTDGIYDPDETILLRIQDATAGLKTPNDGVCGTGTNSYTYTITDATTFTISGTVWNDANGNAVKAAENFTNAGNRVHANLVDPITSKVLQSVLVNPATGAYSFTGAIAGRSYNVILSNSMVTPDGTATLASTTLPNNWVNTGTNIGGTASNTAPSKLGIIQFTVPSVANTTNNVQNLDFGIEQRPEANNQVVNISDKLSVGTVYDFPQLDNNFKAPQLSGSDPEDKPVSANDSISTGGKFTITTLPPAGEAILYYNGAPLGAGAIITSYDPAKLQIQFTANILTTSFQYTITDAAGFADLTPATYTINVLTVLPVTGLKLSVLNTLEKISLQWETISETNTSHFSIAQSADGVNYTETGKIPAAGNSSSIKVYNFAYLPPNKASQIYCRVALVDKDAKQAYSNVVRVTFNNKIKLWPNPAGSFTQVTGLQVNSTIYLTNLNGQVMQTIVTAGTSKLIYTVGIAKGIYLVKVVAGGEVVSVFKLVKE